MASFASAARLQEKLSRLCVREASDKLRLQKSDSRASATGPCSTDWRTCVASSRSFRERPASHREYQLDQRTWPIWDQRRSRDRHAPRLRPSRRTRHSPCSQPHAKDTVPRVQFRWCKPSSPNDPYPVHSARAPWMDHGGYSYNGRYAGQCQTIPCRQFLK